MPSRNPHFGQSIGDYVAKRKARDPAFAVGVEKLRLVRRLRDLRERQGLSQGELAHRLGTGQSAVARFERGDPLPSLDFIQRVAMALGLRLRVDVVGATPGTGRKVAV